MRSASSVCLLVTLFIAPCSVSCQTGETRESSSPRPESAPPAEPERPKIVVLGDSLTAGLGLAVEEAYPALLQQKLDQEGYAFEVVNAGVSGDTTAGGLSRIEWVLEGDVRVLILALGGNDGLRGLPPTEMKRNLAATIERAGERDVAVLLAGIEAPPNMGTAYTSEFRKVFPDLAEEHDVTFLPFLLEGVAGDPQLNQRDGIHPNQEGARRMADTIWPFLQPLLEPVPVP